MAIIYPSQVVALIEEVFLDIKKNVEELAINGLYKNPLTVIIKSIDNIPSNLIRLESKDFLIYLSSVELIRKQLDH